MSQVDRMGHLRARKARVQQGRNHDGAAIVRIAAFLPVVLLRFTERTVVAFARGKLLQIICGGGRYPQHSRNNIASPRAVKLTAVGDSTGCAGQSAVVRALSCSAGPAPISHLRDGVGGLNYLTKEMP